MFIFFHFILLLLLLFISLLLLCLGFASDCLYVPSLSKVDFWCFFYIFVYLSAILLQMLYLFSLMSCFIFEVVVFFSYVAILASSCSWMLHRETKGVVSISDEFEERLEDLEWVWGTVYLVMLLLLFPAPHPLEGFWTVLISLHLYSHICFKNV